MHSTILFPFNADVTDRILTFLPDYSSLLSAVLSSRFVHSVYQDRPNSIIRAVALNLVGPVLPQALRLVRCANAKIHRLPVNALPREDEVTNITTEEATRLVRYSKTVFALEDLFSWRYKDRTSKISRLSDVESLRFQRALYRIWLLCSTHGRDSWPHDKEYFFDPDSDDADIDDHDVQVSNFIDDQKAFLNTFPTPEFRELERVKYFLEQTVSWSVVANLEAKMGDGNPSGPWMDYSFFCGPQVIYEAYTGNVTAWTQFYDTIPEDPLMWFDNFVSDAIWHIFTQRKIPHTPTSDSAYLLDIDSALGQDDKCKQCDSVQGLSLWNATNWSYLRGLMEPYNFLILFKGRLSQNISERIHIFDAYLKTPFITLMDEIYDQKTSSFASWEKEDWLCRLCLEHFLRNHLHLWWIDRKRKAGLTIPEDCWYGYKCRTQMHNPHHATRLNHFCEPTRACN